MTIWERREASGLRITSLLRDECRATVASRPILSRAVRPSGSTSWIRRTARLPLPDKRNVGGSRNGLARLGLPAIARPLNSADGRATQVVWK
jgi:hypothetical protein